MTTYKEFLDNQGEKKWQKYWEDNKLFEVNENPSTGAQGKEKFYGLIEFPYPSGAGLHVGHPRPFTAMDVICRKKRMQGKNVLFPIGFDAFGLPTENFAIKTGRPPAEVTAENIANFTRQLKMLGYSFAWDRAVDTTDPKYYKWTQWIFLQLFKHGLAYKKAMPINWCPSCKIGLANEEVVDGKCERCGTPVEKRNKEQWMLAITKYADKLLQGLETVDYITQAKIQQQNWIGRSEGAEVDFRIKNSDFRITVFTTRPDTLFGATYMVVAPEHSAIQNLKSEISNYDEVNDYVEESKKKTDQDRSDITKEKTGIELKGIKAINPANGEELPIFVADYVLGGYGTGAIMAVPAHDERDWEFAKKYALRVKEVVVKQIGQPTEKSERRDGVAAILFNQKRQIYILKFADGKYALPGGRYEENESVETALKREIIEETGYSDFEIGDFLGTVQTNFFIEPWKIQRLKYQKVYIVNLKSETRQQIKLEPDEIFEGEWKNLDEALKIFEEKNINGQLEFVRRVINPKMINFCDDGIAINSEFLDGLSTSEAKEKMIAWLEEKGIGKRKVQFKLRDWVFSRQRYWGEPIPLVYCENCAKEVNNISSVLTFHAIGGNNRDHWHPWLDNELTKRGIKAITPDMPNTNNPQMNEWLGVAEKLSGKEFNENSVVVGRSLGARVALKFAETHKLKKLILLCPTLDGGKKYWQEIARKNPGFPVDADEKCNAVPIDYKKVEKNVSKIVFLFSHNDPYIRQEFEKHYRENFKDAEFITYEKAGHFGAKDGFIEFADLLNLIIDINPGWIPLLESELPLELPKVEKYEPTDNGESPLAHIDEWVETTCPLCGGKARRETDTMPNWAGSSWYYLAYTMMKEKNGEYVWDRAKMDYWNPVDWYNGGMEHTVLHLLYSRFWNEFLYDIGVVPTSEPYKKRTSHGMILASDGEKMSKSRGNVINPDEMVEKFGTDAFRTYIMFMGPFDQAVAWNTNGVVGMRRFLEKVWTLQSKVHKVEKSIKSKVDILLHQTIKKVGEDIEAMRFNTAISQLMILANKMTEEEQISITNYQLLITLLAPFAPHMAEELWQSLGNKESISLEPWPKYDLELIIDDVITVVAQVNGKVRDEFQVPVDISEEEIKKLVLASDKVQKWLEDKEPKKVIYVKGKLVSIVV